jgi:hypothetical protein
MTGLQPRWTNAQRNSARGFGLIFAFCVCAAFLAASASAQLAPNQTNGFGNGPLVTFTYLQNFDCVDEPTMDLDFNKIQAQSDPNEMQTPICQAVTEPTQDPTGGDLKHTAHLYVLVPMFGTDTNPNDAMQCPNGGRPGELCGVDLGNALFNLFGHIPEAWKTTPTVKSNVPTRPIPYPELAPCTLPRSIFLSCSPGCPVSLIHRPVPCSCRRQTTATSSTTAGSIPSRSGGKSGRC